MKNPLTPAGIEPATYQFVAQLFQRGIDVYCCMLYEYLFLLSGFTSAIYNLLE